jgi:hypothetical protein
MSPSTRTEAQVDELDAGGDLDPSDVQVAVEGLVVCGPPAANHNPRVEGSSPTSLQTAGLLRELCAAALCRPGMFHRPPSTMNRHTSRGRCPAGLPAWPDLRLRAERQRWLTGAHSGAHRPSDSKKPALQAGFGRYRYGDSNPGFRRERAAS